MKKFTLLLLFALISLSSFGAHGDSLSSFWGITVYENDERISRRNFDEETPSYECVEYILRFYMEIYQIDLYDYVTPSIETDDVSVYFAADFFRGNGKSEDGKLLFIKDPDELKPGDIIVYGRTEYDYIGHVAIYIGHGMEIGQNTMPVISRMGDYSGIIRAK